MLLFWGQRGFSPASVFPAGTKGIWLDPSDMSTGFQDAAGTTPVTASGEFVGRRNDKSGNGSNPVQGTAAARPEFTILSSIYSDYNDGSNDGYGLTFSAGTLAADMDCFFAVNRTAALADALVSEPPTHAKYFGLMENGGVLSTVASGGSAWSVFVNGVAVGTTNSCTAVQLNTAVGSAAWKVVEIRNLDLSAWAGVHIGGFGSYFLGGDVGGMILCPAQSATTRANLRRWLGAKVGLSL